MMRDSGGKESRKKWLLMELTTPPELADSISNFVTEIGAQGVLQEELEPQDADDFIKAASHEIVKAYLPWDVHREERLSSLKAYIDDLADIFPALTKVELNTTAISDDNWGEQWKKYFLPLRVSKNIVVKPTWERYTASGHDIVVEIDPGMAFGTGQHPSTRMCIEAVEEIILKGGT
ncbi:MAG: 50S ribosomal protein L11 methyltransferase, partial [Smithellaceae bacterium]|nr:50S ribosomal protein L11 methyltransferase [Smithellaceae bacterium]